MHGISDLRRQLLKSIFLAAVFVCIICSFSLQAFAEIEQFTFEMTEEPVYIDVKTTEEIVDFYENATTSDLLSEKTNTYIKRNIVVQESAQPVERDVIVHTFRLSDVTETDISSAQDTLNSIMEEVFLEITSSLGRKYVSTQVYLYGASCSMNYDSETGNVSELFLHVALVVGEGVGEINNIIENYVRPAADQWRDLPAVKQIIELNKFILDGRFSYDMSLTQRKSTYAFIRDGKGVCEEYAGLTSLFLDELGFENVLVRGYSKETTELEEHVWNLVNIDGKWYHLDILWNGPVDENGNHTQVTTDYLLKSTSTVKANHLAYSIYYPYTELARSDCDISAYLLPETPPEPEEPEVVITPEMELKEARDALAAAIDAAYDIVYRNYYMDTSSSVYKIMPYYTDAKTVYDNPSATLEEIRNQTNTLTFATQNYAEEFVPADKTSLYRYLSQAYGVLLYDYELYDRATVEALIEPYEAAVEVYQNEYATQYEVDKARNNLRTYVKQLVLLEPENPDEPVETTPTAPSEIRPEDLRIIPNLPFIPSTREDSENSEEYGEQTSEVLPEENPEENPSETDLTVPQTENPNITDTTTPEHGESPETNPENGEETTDPSSEHPQPEDPEMYDTPEIPDTPVFPEPVPQKSFSFDDFMRSDVPIYILIALVALGGIIYLVVSRVRRNNEEENEAYFEYEFDDDDDTDDYTSDDVVSDDGSSKEKTDEAGDTAENADLTDEEKTSKSYETDAAAEPQGEDEKQNETSSDDKLDALPEDVTEGTVENAKNGEEETEQKSGNTEESSAETAAEVTSEQAAKADIEASQPEAASEEKTNEEESTTQPENETAAAKTEKDAE
jgi:hypothetical protein